MSATNSCQADYTKYLEPVNFVRTTTAGISTLFCVFAVILLLVLICRKNNSWDSPAHRLILSLLFSALLYSLLTVFQWIRLEYNTSETSYVIICEVVGLGVEYLSWTLMLMTFFLTYHLFNNIYGDAIEKRCCPSSLLAWYSVSYEVKQLVLYNLVSYLVPLLFVWIPFIPGISGYGLSGYWCWIEVCDEDGSHLVAGYVEQTMMWYAPILVLSIIIIILTVAIVWRMYRVKEKSDIVSCPLLSYPFVFLAVNIFGFLNRIVILIIGHPLPVLAFLHAFVDPLWGTLASLTLFAYIGTVCYIDSKTRKKPLSGVYVSLSDMDEEEERELSDLEGHEDEHEIV